MKTPDSQKNQPEQGYLLEQNFQNFRSEKVHFDVCSTVEGNQFFGAYRHSEHGALKEFEGFSVCLRILKTHLSKNVWKSAGSKQKPQWIDECGRQILSDVSCGQIETILAESSHHHHSHLHHSDLPQRNENREMNRAIETRAVKPTRKQRSHTDAELAAERENNSTMTQSNDDELLEIKTATRHARKCGRSAPQSINEQQFSVLLLLRWQVSLRARRLVETKPTSQAKLQQQQSEILCCTMSFCWLHLMRAASTILDPKKGAKKLQFLPACDCQVRKRFFKPSRSNCRWQKLKPLCSCSKKTKSHSGFWDRHTNERQLMLSA